MSQNLISQTMTDVQRDAMLADFNAFVLKWAPYKVELTPEGIANLSKIKPEDIGLLELALNFALQNPGKFGTDLEIEELGVDIALAKQVTIVDQRTHQESNNTRCTLIAVMSDGFVTARKIYRIAQAHGRTPDNAAFLDAFGARFARGGQTPEPPPTP